MSDLASPSAESRSADGPPLRILLANFHKKGYGQATVVRLLARALVEQGHAVLVASPPGSQLAERCAADGVATFTGADFPKTNHLWATWRDVRALRGLLADWKPDIVHSNGSQDTWSLALARWTGSARAPHVFTRHNTKAVHAGLSNRWLYGRRIASVVLAADNFRRSYAPLVASGALDAARLSVIVQPFDERAYAAQLDRGALRRLIGAAPDEPIVGVVARLHPYKGHRHLLAALPAILARAPRARMVALGDGGEHAALKAQAEALGVAGRVHWLGYRSDSPELTAGFTVGVLPSVDGEALPTVLKEAMALGVPCVGTAIGGVPELIVDGVDGYVVLPADPAALAERIGALLLDPALAARIGGAGRDKAWSRFTPEACARAHLALYRNLLARV